LEHFRDEYLCLWVAVDRTKSFRARRDTKGALRLTVWKGIGEAIHVDDAPSKWHPRTPGAECERSARRRLDHLSVELGDPGKGTTYDLLFASESQNSEEFGGFQWRPVDPADALEDIRVFPTPGASFYEAVLGVWDDYVEDMNQAERDSWIEPLSTYRPATEAEVAEHADRTR
jgi:hypothetical protein